MRANQQPRHRGSSSNAHLSDKPACHAIREACSSPRPETQSIRVAHCHSGLPPLANHCTAGASAGATAAAVQVFHLSPLPLLVQGTGSTGRPKSHAAVTFMNRQLLSRQLPAAMVLLLWLTAPDFVPRTGPLRKCLGAPQP